MFAYGATGAGKTHTMLGSQNDPGVMYRTMTELFKRMDEAKEEKEFAVAFSYLEVRTCSILWKGFKQFIDSETNLFFFFKCMCQRNEANTNPHSFLPYKSFHVQLATCA